MKAIILAIALIVAMSYQSVSAHSNHGVDEPTAIAIVLEAVPQFTTKDAGFEIGQLVSSWNAITESDISVVETDGDFYVMQASNPESKTTIFLLIGINGSILDAKFSNDF